MNRVLSLILFLFIPTLALAQPERHELGRRLRLFEESWEAQQDVAIRKEPAANMNTAVMSFFSLKLGEAGRALDKGLSVLLVNETGPAWTELRSLWIKADSHWLDTSAKPLKLKLDRFYPLKDARLQNVQVVYEWLQATDRKSVQSGKESLTVSIPGEFTVEVPEGKGDYILRLTLSDGKNKLSSDYFVVSVSQNRDKRLEQIKDAVSKWSTPFSSHDEVSVSLNVRVLDRLARGETAETDYPADRLLTECEEAVAAIAKKEPYYHTGKLGQFWMGVRTPSKNIVPLRVQTVAVKPGQKVPVVLAMHGAGGSENLFFDGYGNGKVAKLAREKGWFVVAPRSSMSKAGHAETIAELAKVFPEIDTNQVFVVGHSMGAAEAIREANATPGKFAAVAALGGGGSPKAAKDQAEAFKKLPFYVGVGENDFANSQAEALSKSLKKAGADEVTFKRYPGIEHMIIVQEALPEVFQFFEGVQKAKEGK